MRIMSLALRFAGTMALLTAASSSPALAQTCVTDVDCTVPLMCKPGATACQGGGGILPDGGTYTLPTICQTQPATCTWVFITCQADSACILPNWGCLMVPGQSTVKTCFPKYIPCSATQACPTAWSCIDSTQAKHNDPLDVWGVAKGAEYCWPANLVGVIDGSTRTDSSGLGLTGTAAGTDGTATTGTAGTVGGGTNGTAGATGTAGGSDGQGKETGDAGMPLSLGGDGAGMVDSGAAGAPATQPAPASSKSGCTIAGPRGAPAHLALLALALVGLVGLGRAARKK